MRPHLTVATLVASLMLSAAAHAEEMVWPSAVPVATVAAAMPDKGTGSVTREPFMTTPIPELKRPLVDQIIEGINQSESTLIANLRNLHPMVEVYIQNLAAESAAGQDTSNDAYALGRFDWRKGPRMQTLDGTNRSSKFSGTTKNSDIEFVPDGFVAMTSADWQLIDKRRYTITVVRREFLGETRCYVVDVQPRAGEDAGFSGRLWVEDRGFNIVRFNGINRHVEGALLRKGRSFTMDSWRVNVQPGLWLPSYVYVEQNDPTTGGDKTRFKGQVRLWGYDQSADASLDEFGAIVVSDESVKDETNPERQIPPALGERRFEQDAEANLLERLNQASMLATPGNVEQVLETVINNLLASNQIVTARPVKARVLLTSPLDAFTVGHTIVLSRGLLDVLPDEASLAMVLAHELSHIVLDHKVVNTQFAFASKMMVADKDILRTLRVRRDAADETAADTQAVTLLKGSTYRDTLSSAGLFVKLVSTQSAKLSTLVPAEFRARFLETSQAASLSALAQAAPALAPERVDQIPALPLGARLVVDPWARKLELVRGAVPTIASVREKGPLAVTPLAPYLTYARMPVDPAAAAPTSHVAAR